MYQVYFTINQLNYHSQAWLVLLVHNCSQEHFDGLVQNCSNSSALAVLH